MTPFKVKDIITDAVKRTVELFAAYQRGDVVPWPAIETSGFPRESPHFQAFRWRLDKTIRKTRGIQLTAVPGVGLKLMTHDEQVNAHSESRNRRASKQLRKAEAALDAIPSGELTPALRSACHHRRQMAEASRNKIIADQRRATILSRSNWHGVPVNAPRKAAG